MESNAGAWELANISDVLTRISIRRPEPAHVKVLQSVQFALSSIGEIVHATETSVSVANDENAAKDGGEVRERDVEKPDFGPTPKA
ncbi:MAG: hypothetical protein MPJ78_13155 [Hyphomicrobiaceae bacterium]|nr:hypothetical protein [Hyphomicrobiaceae bacterium]